MKISTAFHRFVISITLSFAFTLPASAAILVPGSFETVDIKREGRIIATAIQLNGAIAPPLAEELAKLFETIEPQRRVILDLNSGGGYNSEGYKIIEVIKSERSRRPIDTLVANGARCASMCIPIYVQGEARVAGEVAIFMFHGTATWYSNAINKEETEEYLDVLFERGISSAYINELKTKGVFLEPADFWTTGKQLFDDRSGVVSKLLSPLIKHEPWTAPFDPGRAGPRVVWPEDL